MNKKTKIVLISGLLITTCLTFCISMPNELKPFKSSNGSDQSVTFNSSYTPTDSTEYVSEASKTVGYTTLSFTKVKKYYSDGGFCTLDVGGTIEKTQAFNTLQSFRACGVVGGKLQITTSFNSDFSNPYVYDYTLEANFASTPINVVGNYLKIKALTVAELAWVRVNYGCDNPSSSLSGVTYTDVDNYLSLRLGDDNDTAYVDVKLTSSNSLDASSIYLRNSDNIDDFAIACSSLSNDGNGNYIATFNISQVNWNSGLWTQYTYPARVYVNDVRVDGTDNGNVYVPNRSLTSTTVKNNSKTCAYTIGLTTWSSGGVATISWINNINENSSFTNKGVRFVQMGSNGSASYDHTFVVKDSQGKVYFYISGWVSSLDEAELIAGRYERFTIKAQTSSTSEGVRGLTFNSEPSLCSYEAADGGYKITLAFEVKGLRGDGVQSEFSAIIGLYYDGLPYYLRGGENDGLLHTTACLNKNNDESLCGDNEYAYGHDWYFYTAWNFYDWVRIRTRHA